MSAIGDIRRAQQRSRLPRPRNLDFLYPLGAIAALLGGWQLWVSVGHVPLYLWPSLGDVVHTLAHSGNLRHEAWVTTTLVLIGFALAVVLGLSLAALVVSFRSVEIGVFPLLVGMQFVPLIAIAPLFVIWFGFGSTPQILIIMLFGYFSVFISTLSGLQATGVERLYLAQTMAAGNVQTFLKIRLPAALPQIFGGLKIAITSAVIGAVVAEFTIGAAGIGGVILQASGVGDSSTLLAGVIYLGVIGTLAFWLVGLIERLAIPWHSAQRRLTATSAH